MNANPYPFQEARAITAVRAHAALTANMEQVLADLKVSLMHHVGRISPECAILQLAAHIHRTGDYGLLLAALVTAERAQISSQSPDVAYAMMENAQDAMTQAVDDISAKMGRLSAKYYGESAT